MDELSEAEVEELAKGKETWEPEGSGESIVDLVDNEGNLLTPSGEEEEEEEKSEEKGRRDRRIDQLTARHRDAERKNVAAEAENRQLRDRLDRLETGANKQQVDTFKSLYEETRTALYTAFEEGNTEKQVELTEKIADMRAAARVADMQAPAREPLVKEMEAPPPQKAMTWWNKNRWFNDPEHTAESAYARAVDQKLDSEGYDKDSQDYYDELDNRLQARFPELYKKESKSKPKAPILPSSGKGPGSNTRPAKGRIRLTAERMEVARTLGITSEEDLREYAKECQLLEDSQ